MKAEIKPRIELTGRTRLEEVIPLATPFTVFVDPSSACNFKCRFCPTGNPALLKRSGRYQGLLDFDLYRKIIDDLRRFPSKLKVLRLYKDGEPLLHPKFAEMVEYGKQSGCAERIDTTTNASLLTPELNLRLIAAGLDRINISIEGLSEEQYRAFSGNRVDFKKCVDTIAHLYAHRKRCEVVIKTVRENLLEGDEERFYAIFGDSADRIFIENMAPCWPEFDYSGVHADFSVGIYGQNVGSVDVCPYVFYSLAVNSDGTVSLCFLDWERKLVIGDARTHSLVDIWNGEVLREFRILMLERRRTSHPVCRNCGQLTNCMPDDIDAYAPELLEKIKRQAHG